MADSEDGLFVALDELPIENIEREQPARMTSMALEPAPWRIRLNQEADLDPDELVKFHCGADIPEVRSSTALTRSRSTNIYASPSASSSISQRYDSVVTGSDGVTMQAFRYQLKFFNVPLAGKINETRFGAPIDLPRLRPETFKEFLKALSSSDGHVEAFEKLKALCVAFVVSTALEDKPFQRKVIEKIRDRVAKSFESVRMDNNNLTRAVMERTIWAWEVQAPGRVGLREALTTSLAFVITGWDKAKKEARAKTTGRGKKRKLDEDEDEDEEAEPQPVLKMNTLLELEKEMGRHGWFEEEFLPTFVKKCIEVVKHNASTPGGQWKMLPVSKLYPDEITE